MAHWQSNRSDTTVKSRYSWCWLRKGNNGKANRKAMRYLGAERPFNMMMYLASLQNPPSGPPIFSL